MMSTPIGPRRVLQFSLPLVPLFLLAACDGSKSVTALDSAIAAVSSSELAMRITITPRVDTIPQVGESIQLSAAATGNAKVKWQSLDPYAIITEPGMVTGVQPGRARIVAKAGSAADTAIVWIAPAPASMPPAAVVITPATDTIDVVGGTVQLAAVILDAHGNPVQDQTIVWSTPDAGTVWVSATGTVNGLAQGVALVVAAAGTLADTATIWVAPGPAAVELRIDPGLDTIPDIGASVSLRARALDAAGNVVASPQPNWHSLDPSIADVAATGVPATNMSVTGKGPGVARIVATQQTMKDTAWVTVEVIGPQPSAVRVSPRTDTIASVGGTRQLKAEVLDQAGNVITGSTVSWQALDPSVVAVSVNGQAQGVASGVGRVRAYSDAFADTARIWVAPVTTQPTPGTYPIPGSIDPTGNQDVTDELSAFFASVPDGSTIVFPAGATYRSEGTLMLMDRNGLTFEGNGALIFANTDGSGAAPHPGARADTWPRQRSHWAVHFSTEITFRDMRVRGANPNAGTSDAAYVSSLESQHGFAIRGSGDIELDRVTITDVYGDFVYLGEMYGFTNDPRKADWTSGVHIHDSHFDRNGRQGLAITAAEDILFERNYMGGIRRTAFDVEPNADTGGARRMYILDNKIGANRLNFFSAHGRKGTLEDIEFARNTATDKLTIQFDNYGPRRRRITIIDNVALSSFGSTVPMMRFYLIDGLTVRGNVQPTNAGRDMTGVYVAESCGIDVGGNDFANALKEYEIIPYTGCT